MQKRCPKRLALLALAAALLMTGLLSLFPIHSFDIWWHLRTGQLIVEELRVPATDPFSYTAAGRPWVTHEWLSEVLFFGLFRLGGENLLVIFKVCASVLAILLGAAAALVGDAEGKRWPAVALGVLLAAPLISARAFVRPHMLTAVMLGAVILFLRLNTVFGRWRWAWWLVPLFALWANIHSGFLLGILLVILYWTGELLGGGDGPRPSVQRSFWRHRGPLLILIIAAALINPHHIQALLYPLKLIFRPEIRGTIAELQSIFRPVYRGALFRMALLLITAAMIPLVVLQRRRLNWPVLVPFVAFFALSLRSVRGLTECAVLVPAAIGLHGRFLGKRLAVVVSALVIILAAALAATVLSHGIPVGQEQNRRIGLGVNPVNRPAGTVRFLGQASPQGRIFNVMAFGGYLIYRLWPNSQVYVDGRLDVYPPGFLDRYHRLMSTGEGWEEQVRSYGISTALVDYAQESSDGSGLRARLRRDPNWACVFFGDNALVYMRKDAGNEPILDRFACAFDPSRRSFAALDAFAVQSSPEELDGTLAALERIADLAPDEQAPALVLGRLLDRLGHSGRGAEYLQRAVQLDPSSKQALVMWAEALSRAGNHRMAARELRSLLERSPDDVPALLVLADVEREMSGPQEASLVLQQAAAAAPDHFLVHLRLGVLSAQLGDLQKARAYFRKAERIQPGDPAVRRNLEKLDRIEKQTE